MGRDLLSDSVERLLRERCTPKHVAAIEAGAPGDALWRATLELGLADALVTDVRGGAGLGLRDVFPVLLACGAHAVPLPLAQTMVARAILAGEGIAPPDGPMTFGAQDRGAPAGVIACSRVPYGAVSEWVLVEEGRGAVLLRAEDGRVTRTGVRGSLEADLRWADLPAGARRIETPHDGRAVAAWLLAAQLAGAMGRVLSRTVAHANERRQFGRSIGSFQAIQQQLSVMAEHALAARTAAQLGCEGAGPLPDPLRAGVAKARASEAAAVVGAIAHAVHGAMGMTEELDLQLHTRRLSEWRTACGSESYWFARIGRALLGAGETSALDFVRERLSAPRPGSPAAEGGAT